MQRFTSGALRPPRALLPWKTHTRAFASEGVTPPRTTSSWAEVEAASAHQAEGVRRVRRVRIMGPERRRVKRLPRTTPLRVYELSDLVLELDAEDSPHVRAFNAADEKKELERWSRTPRLDALVQRAVSFRKELKANNELWISRLQDFDARRISSRDVLAAALLGPPRKPADGSQAALDCQEPPQSENVFPSDDGLGPLTSTILRSIGVSERMASDDHRIVSILLRRLDFQDPQTTDERKLSTLKEEFKGRKFRDVKRIIGPLLGTHAGCNLVSHCGPEIVDVCTRDSQLRDAAYRRQVVSLLMNLSINLASRGLSREDFPKPSGPELLAFLNSWQSRQQKL